MALWSAKTQNNNKTSQNSKIPSKFDGDVVNFIVWNRRDILQDIFKIRVYSLQDIFKNRQQADNFVGPKKKLTPNLMIFDLIYVEFIQSRDISFSS